MSEKVKELPEGYREGVDRVSDIVSFVFPFKWTDGEKRYKRWLEDKGIDEAIYLSTAQEMWTYVHEALEHYIINWKKKRIGKNSCRKEIEHWIKRIDELWLRDELIYTEKYVLEENNRFQWAVDLLYKKDWKWILADWKTYGLCKKKFWLENKFTIPTHKRKKVELQMSFYCYALKQQGIEVEEIELLFLHEEGIKVVSFTPLPDKIIEEILEKWEWKNYTF